VIKSLARALVPASILKERERRVAQRNWTVQLEATAGGTRITFCIPSGLGDRMIARQFLEEFEALAEFRSLGLPPHVVIVAGAWRPEFTAPRGDLNFYWWWSMGGRRDWLSHFLSGINVKPDAILCLSRFCEQEAQSLGLRTIYLPLGVGRHFQPPAVNSRCGIGYAGSKGHKDPEQEATVLGPFLEREDFHWVDNLKSPQELSAFYGERALVLGMTERLQEEMGMVNNRVFEVLATDTPFIIHRHRALEEVLGVDFPWQAGTRGEAEELAEELLGDGEAVLHFRELGAVVRERHSWRRRIEELTDGMAAI
jgi:hypothetical protein